MPLRVALQGGKQEQQNVLGGTACRVAYEAWTLQHSTLQSQRRQQTSQHCEEDKFRQNCVKEICIQLTNLLSARLSNEISHCLDEIADTLPQKFGCCAPVGLYFILEIRWQEILAKKKVRLTVLVQLVQLYSEICVS